MTTSRATQILARPAVWFVLLGLLSGGCAQSPRRSELPVLEDVNVLLIVIDTMGRSHVGCLTSGLETTPRIDALADESVFFPNTYSTAPWTQPAIASLLTGLTPSRHRTLHIFDVLPAQFTTLAEHLAQRRFTTSGIITHMLLEEKLGYRQGFENYDDTAIAGHRGISSPQATRLALRELDRLKDERFFLMVHFFDPHSEYLHHPRFDRTSDYQGPARLFDRNITELRKHRFEMTDTEVGFLRELYREEIAFTDHHVGLILDKLDSLGLSENTLVILTADHGEEFMEHDWIGHTRYLHDTVIQVPLMFRLPGRLQPVKLETPASLADVMPTLLDLSRTRLEDSADLDGISLRTALLGDEMDPDRPVFSEVAFVAPDDEQGTHIAEKEAFKAAVTRRAWRLIHDLEEDTWHLYDRAADPGELEDLYAPDHPQALELQPMLQGWLVGKAENWGKDFEGMQRMTDEERERLRSLGYVR